MSVREDRMQQSLQLAKCIGKVCASIVLAIGSASADAAIDSDVTYLASNPDLRQRLQLWQDAAPPALRMEIDRLRSDDAVVFAGAIGNLKKHGKAARGAILALIDNLQYPNQEVCTVRRGSTECLGPITNRMAMAVAALDSIGPDIAEAVAEAAVHKSNFAGKKAIELSIPFFDPKSGYSSRVVSILIRQLTAQGTPKQRLLLYFPWMPRFGPPPAELMKAVAEIFDNFGAGLHPWALATLLRFPGDPGSQRAILTAPARMNVCKSNVILPRGAFSSEFRESLILLLTKPPKPEQEQAECLLSQIGSKDFVDSLQRLESTESDQELLASLARVRIKIAQFESKTWN